MANANALPQQRRFGETSRPDAWWVQPLLVFLGFGAFFYGAVFAAEGIGLYLRKHWAEYFTIVTTSLFIPLEVYELARHVTATRIVVGIMNVLIVWYLVLRVRSRKEG